MGDISIDEYNKLSSIISSDSKKEISPSKETTHQDEPVVMIDTNNWFGNTTFAHRGVIYRIDEIIALKSNSTTTTMNFVPSHYTGFSLTLSGASDLEYKGQSFAIKTQKVKNLSEAYNYISKKTFEQRANFYIHQLQKNGYFQYNDYLIYSNGDIKHKNTTVNIAEAGLQDRVEIGRSSSFGWNSYYTPDEINIYLKVQGKFLPQGVCLKTKENRDIIYAIIMQLAKLKGGKARFAQR
jgi:hypothetical protein